VIALIGCGFRAFSMDSMRIAQIKSVIRSVDVAVVEERVSALSKRLGGTIRDDLTDLALELGVEL
jgi:signal transduction protein with GAF and PtsI domain